MTVELRPLGVACNLACTYCYQEPMRKAGNKIPKYDIDKMLAEAESTGQSFSLFGGEALLVPKKDLEKIWKRGYELHKSNGIQTNGTLIDDEHIEMFKKYNVHVGVSIDGVSELNELREVRGKEGDKQATLESTNKIIENIRKMLRNGISVSVIITLHRANGSKERLPRLLNFIRWLGDIGVKNGNIHMLEVDETMPDQEINVLSQEENIYAFKKLAEFFKENKDLHYHPFNMFKEVLTGDDSNAICYFKNCDHMNTQAVYGIEGNGGLSNCGRTNKEGIDFYKADDNGYERYISLYYTPHEYGGCKGCRFWMLCGGHCPGEAINHDFRNKTANCQTVKFMLSYYEQELINEGKIPFTKLPYLKQMELYMLEKFKRGEFCSIKEAKEVVKNRLKAQVPVKK